MKVLVNPLLIGCQVAPESVLLDSPVFEILSEAYKVVGVSGSITSRDAAKLEGPILFQLPALSVLLYSAATVVAYNVAGVTGSIASETTLALARPLLAGFHDCPASVLLKTPVEP